MLHTNDHLCCNWAVTSSVPWEDQDIMERRKHGSLLGSIFNHEGAGLLARTCNQSCLFINKHVSSSVSCAGVFENMKLLLIFLFDYIICDCIIIFDCIFDYIICDCIIIFDCIFDYIICDCIFYQFICDYMTWYRTFNSSPNII